MVVASVDAVIPELESSVLALLLRSTVDDAALARELVADEGDDVVVDALVLRLDLVLEVRTVERRAEDESVLHAEVVHDVLLDSSRGGRRERHDRHAGEVLLERPHLLVVGACSKERRVRSFPRSLGLGRTEVVTPGADAMRLVEYEAGEELATVELSQDPAKEVALDDLRKQVCA